MLKMKYASKADIPSEYIALFSEKGGEWVFTGVAGMKTQEDIDTLQTSLQAERNAHKDTKGKLNAFGGKDAAETLAEIDKIEEYKAAAGGKLDETKINELVETRINARLAPVQRELDTANTNLGEANDKIGVYVGNERRTNISGMARDVATKLNVVGTATDDVIMYANAQMEVNELGQVVTNANAPCGAGMNAEVWLTDLKATKGHWFPASQGAGASGGQGGGQGGANPFSKDGWNLTEQGKMLSADRDTATQMAKSAGTSIGGARPAK
jgi:hypothetical protein